MKHLRLYFICLFLGSVSCVYGFAQNLRQVSHEDGLSSNAVFSICQDRDGMLWIGALDGLYLYHGQKFTPVCFSDGATMEGHLVECVLESDDSTLWAQSAHGLRKFNRLLARETVYTQFEGLYRIRKAPQGGVLILDRAGKLHLFRRDLDAFVDLNLPLPSDEDLVDVGSADMLLWTAGRHGLYTYRWLKDGEGITGLDNPVCIDPSPVRQCVFSEDKLYLAGEDGWLTEFSLESGKGNRLFFVGDELQARGPLTGVVHLNGSLFLSFEKGGVLRYGDGAASSPEIEDLGITAGVFQMYKDRWQDLIWIATDGQGIFMYWEAPYLFHSHISKDVNPSLDKPVRSLFQDSRGRLWVGTKGAGLLCVDRKSFDGSRFLSHKLYRESSSPLLDDSVYAMAPGTGGFWIGSDGGLNFFDYGTDSILPVEVSQKIPYVHSIREIGDTTLWLATVGAGVYTGRIKKDGRRVALVDIRRFTVDNGYSSSNYFFCLENDADGNIWIGNRGSGLWRISIGGMVSVPLASGHERPTVNDVFSLCSLDGVLWTGTGNGVVGLDGTGKELFIDKSRGLPNNSVHSLLPDTENGLWIATNDGLARLDANRMSIEHYGRDKGLKVNEFSDGAAYAAADELFFGGVNGWVEIKANPSYVPKPVTPFSVNFDFMSLDGNEVNLFALLNSTDRKIVLRPDQNSVVFRFAVTDNIDAEQYDYHYRLMPDASGKWINNGPAHSISFARMQPGTYHLYVKGVNRVSGHETPPADFVFTIMAPWYATSVARLFWALLAASILGLIFLYILKRTEHRNAVEMERLQQRHKEEMYEEKLRFFTNITHEFCTPLTLIYSPCERILSHEGTDDFVRRYVSLIRSNAIRLNSLIQEIIDYRRLETGHQMYHLVPMDVSALTGDVCDSFTDMTSERGINLETGIEGGIIWNLDRRCYTRILSNLMSNALKYTPSGGTVRVGLETREDNLVLKVFNTGKGIKEEDRRTIFNSFRILDNIEEDAMKGLASRNGLGLAICHSMAELLKGKIEVESEEGAWARFVVTLPRLEATAESEAVPDPALAGDQLAAEDPAGISPLPDLHPEAEGVKDRSRSLVLIVDDNPEILAMLRETLSVSYRVMTASGGDAAIEMVKEESPDLIITDVLMPGTDGLSLIRQLKKNKHTMHIPTVIISALGSRDDQVRGLLSGGDAYVSKPFSISYLQAVVARLLQRSEDLREYYNSSASAFGYTDGKLLTVEDKTFVRSVNDWVEENISKDITVKQMADHFNLSLRNLYRKFSSLSLLPPKDFIKERRMERAARLLRTTDMTVQEVIYESGFNNRAHFYNEFEKKYGMTPKAFRNERKTKDDSLS